MGDFTTILEENGVWLNPRIRTQVVKAFQESDYCLEDLKKAFVGDDKLGFQISKAINYPLLPPKNLLLTVTTKCNLKCKMCNFPTLNIDNELPLEKWKELIGEGYEMGIRSIVITGGEPLLNKGVLELAKYGQKKGMYVSMQTNGILIRESQVPLICESINNIGFSIDGLEKNHDFIRGKGTFQKTLNAISQIKNQKESLEVYVVTVLMNHNFKDIPKIIENMKKWGVDKLNIQPLMPNNLDYTKKDEKQSLWVKPENIKELGAVLEKVKQFKKKGVKIDNNEYHLDRFTPYFKGELTPSDFECYNGFKFISVWSTGSIGLCLGQIGDVNTSSLKDIWYGEEAYKIREQIKHCKKPCMQNCQEL